jgi:ABC-type antimicrobial peptide transport system permease subunit
MRFRIDPASAGSKNIDLRSKFLKPLYLLSGIVALILLVVCVNLASLTLARASARRHEISTRIALGATPWQAIRQLVVESLFLSTKGALSGPKTLKISSPKWVWSVRAVQPRSNWPIQ